MRKTSPPSSWACAVDEAQGPMKAECLGYGRDLTATRRQGRRRDDCQFVQHDGRVLDKHGVGHIVAGGKRLDMKAEGPECIFEQTMLGCGPSGIDWLSFQE